MKLISLLSSPGRPENAMGSKSSEKSAALLLDLEEEISALLAQQLGKRGWGTEEQRTAASCEIGKALADSLSISWGGHPVYIPKDHKRRAAMMYQEFTGDNHTELARKYGLCEQSVYRILKRERDSRRKYQGSLLDFT